MDHSGVHVHVDNYFDEFFRESGFVSPVSSFEDNTNEEEISDGVSECDDTTRHCFFKDVPHSLPEVIMSRSLDFGDSFSEFVEEKGPEFRKEIISSGWLATHYSTIAPADVVHWLFETVAYSNDLGMRIFSFNTFQYFLTGISGSITTNNYPPLAWIPDETDFVVAFKKHGCDFASAHEERHHMVMSSKYEERLEPYIENVQYILKLLAVCLRHSPRTYTPGGVKLLIFGLFRMSFDEDTAENAIGAALEWFRSSEWDQEVLADICCVISSKQFCSSLQHTKIILGIFPPVLRGEQFRNYLCSHLLARHVGLTMIDQDQVSREFSFNEFVPLLLEAADLPDLDTLKQILQILSDRLCNFLSLPMIASRSFAKDDGNDDSIFFDRENEGIRLIPEYLRQCRLLFQELKREENPQNNADISELDNKIGQLQVEIEILKKELDIIDKLK